MFGVFTKHENKDVGNKCPMCREIFRDFIIIDSEKMVLACEKCGCIFFDRTKRKEYLNSKNTIIKPKLEARKESEENRDTGLTCPVCKKVCGSKAGLGAHMRSHVTTSQP